MSMNESFTGLKRTGYCGDFRLSDAGKEVTVFGWCQRQRDIGSLIFIDLRDRTGIIQLAFDESDTEHAEAFKKAFSVRSEFVLAAKGLLRKREGAFNTKIPTGEVEIAVHELRILGEAETTPFEIVEDSNCKEDLRLKYRFLDLRRPDLQKNIILRHKLVKAARDYFDDNGFIEIETPILIKSTPEGARDFLVPSRQHKGEFYALPQSPQLYKQLCMVSGFDRYVQFARCFRDEDLRADRQPEFTQIDMEMSFVDVEDVMQIGEGFIKYIFKKILDKDIETPLPRMTYNEAMERFGSDKPDTRFAMELIDLTEETANCGFSVFSDTVKAGGAVKCITVKNGAAVYTRKEIDKLTEKCRGIGAKGLAWVRLTPEGTTSSFAKFMTEEEMTALLNKAGAETGDVVLIIADKRKMANSVLGMLRLTAAKRMDIIADTFNLLWITEFPFFEWDDELNTFVAMHHPFTAPMEEDIPLLDTDKGKVRARCYDLVFNGIELSSGSIRITDPELQTKMFRSLGISDEESKQKFGYLLDAFKYGAPPHGGMGIGLDRLVMQMLGAESLRDVTAFPKMQNMRELMTDCPSKVDEIQLEELGITLNKEEKTEN